MNKGGLLFLKSYGGNIMLLAIDIGNTNITLGGYYESELRFVSRLATERNITADQYAVQLSGVIGLYGYGADDFEDAVISSVVPSAGSAIAQAVKTITGKAPLVIGPGVKTGLNIKIDNPAQLGADLAAGAVGALGKYKLPCIIVDMGTATTLSVIDKNGAFLGGAIAAGIRSTLDALTSNTTQLPSIYIEAPKSVIGKNTVECMQSGLVVGAAAMLEGLIDRIENELSEKTTVVATGGLAHLVVSHCRRDIVIDDNLLLDGLYKIYLKNQ